MKDNTRAAHTAAAPTSLMSPNDDGLSNWQFGVARATYDPISISSYLILLVVCSNTSLLIFVCLLSKGLPSCP